MSATWLPLVAAFLRTLAAATEPGVPRVPDLHIPAGQAGERLQVNFPPEAHAGSSRGTYWLTDDEPVVADIEIRRIPVRRARTCVCHGRGRRGTGTLQERPCSPEASNI